MGKMGSATASSQRRRIDSALREKPGVAREVLLVAAVTGRSARIKTPTNPWVNRIRRLRRKIEFVPRRWNLVLDQLIDHFPTLRGAMTKNETELNTRRAQAANNHVGAPPGAKRASYRPCILSAALVALFSVAAWPQTQLATVSGTITDPTGA